MKIYSHSRFPFFYHIPVFAIIDINIITDQNILSNPHSPKRCCINWSIDYIFFRNDKNLH